MTTHADLVCLPTLNEAGNIGKMLQEILALRLGADILVIDDGSTDGTDRIVEEIGRAHPQVTLMQRGSRQGIGSAHTTALRLAKQKGYARLITLDADFSHSPSDIPRFLAASGAADIVIGTRFAREGSLREWNLLRKAITRFGHFLTRLLLALPYDASGGFRVYVMARIPQPLIDGLNARNYEFFFESLTLMHRSGLSIVEIPIDLPARTYGESKMQLRHMVGGLYRLLRLSWRLRRLGPIREGARDGSPDHIGA